MDGRPGGLVGFVVCYVGARRQLTSIIISILTLAIQLAFIGIVYGLSEITVGNTGLTFEGFGLAPVRESLGLPEHFLVYYIFLLILAG